MYGSQLNGPRLLLSSILTLPRSAYTRSSHLLTCRRDSHSVTSAGPAALTAEFRLDVDEIDLRCGPTASAFSRPSHSSTSCDDAPWRVLCAVVAASLRKSEGSSPDTGIHEI